MPIKNTLYAGSLSAQPPLCLPGLLYCIPQAGFRSKGKYPVFLCKSRKDHTNKYTKPACLPPPSLLFERQLKQFVSRTYFKNPSGCNFRILASCAKKFFRLTQVKHQNLFGPNPLKILKFRLQIIFKIASNYFFFEKTKSLEKCLNK